jgi:hypothetical protein
MTVVLLGAGDVVSNLCAHHLCTSGTFLNFWCHLRINLCCLKLNQRSAILSICVTGKGIVVTPGSAHTYNTWRLITGLLFCIKMGIHLFGALYVLWSGGYYLCFVIVRSVAGNPTRGTDYVSGSGKSVDMCLRGLVQVSVQLQLL